jgi:hypothetical protein
MQTVGESGVDPVVVSGLVRQALAEGRVEAAIAAARAWGLPKLDAAALNALAWQGLTKLAKDNSTRDLKWPCPIRVLGGRYARPSRALRRSELLVKVACKEGRHSANRTHPTSHRIAAMPRGDASLHG